MLFTVLHSATAKPSSKPGIMQQVGLPRDAAQQRTSCMIVSAVSTPGAVVLGFPGRALRGGRTMPARSSGGSSTCVANEAQ